MNISNDDLIYGARSGIQKAIRRGDLDLAKTCFDLLWGDKSQQNWLKWRMTTLVLEEAWHMAGELNKLQQKEDPTGADYRALIYKLTLCSKSKDAVGLWFIINEFPKVSLDFDEINLMKHWNQRYQANGKDEGMICDEIYETAVGNPEYTELTAYEISALQSMRRRSKMGGMTGDRCICMSAMLLTISRGLDPDLIQSDLKKQAKKWKAIVDRGKPITVEMPWYAFDMHTQCGKIAKSIFGRNKLDHYSNLSVEKFSSLWFWCESAFTPPYLLQLKRPQDEQKANCLDTIWYAPYLKRKLPYAQYTAKEVVRLWSRSMRRDIQGCVEWIVNKRSEKK